MRRGLKTAQVRVDELVQTVTDGKQTRSRSQVYASMDFRHEVLSPDHLKTIAFGISRPSWFGTWWDSGLKDGMIVTLLGSEYVLRKPRYDNIGRYWIGVLEGCV